MEMWSEKYFTSRLNGSRKIPIGTKVFIWLLRESSLPQAQTTGVKAGIETSNTKKVKGTGIRYIFSSTKYFSGQYNGVKNTRAKPKGLSRYLQLIYHCGQKHISGWKRTNRSSEMWIKMDWYHTNLQLAKRKSSKTGTF